jgi:DDE superfamily endonuclease
VECTFGLLNGCFRILKSGIRMSGTECADNIILTCCALHNWLLQIDGLDLRWEGGVPSDWEGENFHIPHEVQSSANVTLEKESGDEEEDVATMDDTTVTANASVAGAENNGQLQAGEKDGTEAQLPNAIHRLHHPMVRRDGLPPTTENVVDDVDSISDDSVELVMSEEEEPLTVKTVGGITRVS